MKRYKDGLGADDLTRLKLNCRQLDKFIISNFDKLKHSTNDWVNHTREDIKTEREFKELLNHMEKEIKRIKKEL